MTGIHLQTTVDGDGTLRLRGLPSLAGHRVHVIVHDVAIPEYPTTRYPLRGEPLRYERPFDGVALDDWDVEQ